MGSQAKKISMNLLSVKLELGPEFQYSGTISVYNHTPSYGCVCTGWAWQDADSNLLVFKWELSASHLQL